MPKVVNQATGKTIVEIDGNLLEDFFDEIFIEEKTLEEVLRDYKPAMRTKISKYIIHRLAEVDPGYTPRLPSFF